MNRYACLLLCAFAVSANAAGWVHVDQINASELPAGSSGVRFGTAVAVDLVQGTNQVRALYVGAPRATVTFNGTDQPEAGKVFVFVPGNGGWQLSTTLEPLLKQSYSHFGAALAVNHGVVIVGQPDYDNGTHTNAGRIAVFDDYRWSTPNLPPTFTSVRDIGYTLDNAHLGSSVAVSGDGLLTGGAGSWGAGGAPGMVGAGCAYLYYLADGLQVTDKGNVCGASSGDTLGSSVAVYSFGASNMLMVAGAPGESALTGAAHVYYLSGGNLALLSNLQAQNPTQFDFFGTSVAIDSQRIYVGGTGRNKSGVGRTGSVTLFNPGGANHYTFGTEVFPAISANPGDLCGASVYPNAIGDGFAMGCPGSDAQASGEGFARAVQPFDFLGSTLWIDQVLQMGGLPHGVDDMGRGVVMVGDRVFAGAPFADDLVGSDNGAVQIFGHDQLFIDGFDG